MSIRRDGSRQDGRRGGAAPDSGSSQPEEAATRDLYRDLFERSADAILIIEDEAFVDCNQATVEMLRYETREQLLQTHPSELSPEYQPDGKASFDKANEMMAIAMTQGSHRFEWDHLRADGEVFPVEVLLTPVRRGDKTLIHTVWRDLTEQKRLETELHQSSKLEAIGKLTGGIAHDFNNLLVAIIGNSELLELDLEPESPLREYVGEIRSACERASDLVSQLLAYSRKQVLRPTVLDLNDILGGVLPMMRHLLGEDIVTRVDIAPTALPVYADGGQLERVVMNLTTNGREAMPSGGTLTIETFETELGAADPRRSEHLEPGRYGALRVTDEGEGIDPSRLVKIFDPFFTTKSTGTGLGLSTAIGIARQSGGDIKVVSEARRGASFTVYLPLSSGAMAVADEPHDEALVVGSATESILLVEDEPSVALLAERVLRKEGYAVSRAANGMQALEMVEQAGVAVDLLLTDVVMPHLSGPDLVRRLRANSPNLKVLFVSGYTTESLQRRGSLDEEVDFIMKPYSMAELKRRVRAALDAG